MFVYEMHKSIRRSYIAHDLGHVDGVQDLGVVVDAEGSHHAASVLLVFLLVFHLG